MMKPRFIIESFWQRHSNCACIAFIKALLLKFGFRKSFQVTHIGKTIVVTLMDGWSVALGREELKQLNKRNGILYRRYGTTRDRKTVEKIRAYVELCFAILVRSMQLRRYAGKEYTATEAIESLVKEGVETIHFHKMFGVRRTAAIEISRKNITRLKRVKGALLFNDRHITVADSGYFEDIGVAVRISDEIPELLYGEATHWYKFK